MSEQTLYVLLLLIIALDFVLKRTLQYLNNKSARKPIPSELQGIYDEEKYEKSEAFQRPTFWKPDGHIEFHSSFYINCFFEDQYSGLGLIVNTDVRG